MNEEEKKAIEECKEFLKEKSSTYINYYNEEFNQRTFWFSNLETLLNFIQKKQKEIELKDKVIDEMAEHIASSAVADDTVCAINFECNCNEKECNHKEILVCTKQYFINKVKEDKE